MGQFLANSRLLVQREDLLGSEENFSLKFAYKDYQWP